TEHTRAYLKIEDGCNQFCSYCIIPYVRGRVRSRAEEEILAEVERLASEGYREVVLTGIHLSSYGLDKKVQTKQEASEFDVMLAPKEASEEAVLPLLDLLKKVQEVRGIERIRLSSLEPRIMTEAFVKEIASLSKLCPHFHLSLQSGCDATLKRMNRKYTTAEYKKAVECLRRYFERPAITTDIIVGFPGETDEEFAKTLRFVRDIAFSQIHIFKYSRRRGTVADRMEAQIPEPVKTKRSEALSALEKELEQEYRGQFAGVTEPVLFEERITAEGAEYLTGHTTRYIKVAVAAAEQGPQPNETANVRLSDTRIKDAVLSELV
ncbi:MAG: MiaB/RimO family radical SAM methylthiotransferase, partial [Lachnospiraceae bacterium]